MDARWLTVVYADDDECGRETIWAMLTEAGIDVRTCANGRQALELCRDVGPDTVLLDINMPEMDGLEAARRLRADPATSTLRLVAITGQGTWALRQKALEAGFNEFLSKPIPTDVLIRALSAI